MKTTTTMVIALLDLAGITTEKMERRVLKTTCDDILAVEGTDISTEDLKAKIEALRLLTNAISKRHLDAGDVKMGKKMSTRMRKATGIIAAGAMAEEISDTIAVMLKNF